MSRVLQRKRLIHACVISLYAMLAVVATWPLVRYLGTHVPGSYNWAFDEYTFVWNTWWFRYSIFDLGQNPLYSNHIFYPLGIGLVLYTYNLFNALVSLPFQSFLSLAAISNLTFLFTTILSAYGTFLLVEYLLREMAKQTRDATNRSIPYLAAFLAGLVYAFGSYRMVYAAMGHYDMWSTAWIPLYSLFLVKAIREPRLMNAVVAGVLMALAMYCEMIFGVFLAMLTLILLAFAVGRKGRKAVAGGLPALVKRLAVMGVVALLLYLPLLVPILAEMFGGYELTGWGDAEKLSTDLVGLVTPTALHPWGGDWVETLHRTLDGTARFRDVNTVFLGWAGLGLAVIGALCYWRRLAAWISSFVVFTLFSLGPLLQINGRSIFDLDGLMVNVPLPFILLHYIPIVKANRVPNRFSVVLMLALAVLVGFGIYWLLTKLGAPSPRSASRGRRFLLAPGSLLLAALLIFEHWSVPLPLTDARIPVVYETVAAEKGDFAILQLPMGWRNSFGVQGAENTRTEYYQTFHHKRLLSGNISRNPPFKFDYFRQVPILESLIAIQTYDQVDAERRAADQATAAEFVSFYDLRYVVVAPGVPGRPPYVDTRDDAVAYVEQVLPIVKIFDQDGWLLYRVQQSPLPDPFVVDVGTGELRTVMALGEGWAGAEEIQGVRASWVVEQGARVFLPASAELDYRLAVTALPFDYPGAEVQGLAPEINGQPLERKILSPGWQTYTWEVPASYLRPGLNDVRFALDRLDPPADVLPGSGVIGGTGLRAPIAIEVNSGGLADFAFITIGEGPKAEDGSAHHPGYNVALIQAKTGKLLERQGFNTTASGSEAEAEALVQFISQAPEGTIVAVALQGDGTVHLTDQGIAALRSIGGQVDLRDRPGWSHAIIGVKGSAPGPALEAAAPDSGWLRVAPDWRTLGIAVDTIQWQQIDP